MSREPRAGWGLAVVLAVGSAQAQSAVPGPDGRAAAVEAPARGSLSVVFEDSAVSLPEAEIRAAIAQELGPNVDVRGDGGGAELSIGVDRERGLVVRYRTSRGALERYLPLPSRPEDTVLMIALAAGNLARDPTLTPGEAPSATVEADEPAPPPANEPTPARPPVMAEWPAAPPPSAPKRHFLGLHVAQDVTIVGGSNVCDLALGQRTDNFACFYEGTGDQPFFHTPYPYKDAIVAGAVFATTRLLFAYDYAPAPLFSIGARLGYAFGGGPPAGQVPRADAATSDPNDLPARATATGGSPFLPVHAELRLALWYLPLDGRPLSAYLVAGGGVAQVDAKTTVLERDCADTRSMSWDSANGDFTDCRTGASNFAWPELPETRVDAWKKLGQGFVKAGTGFLLRPAEQWGIVAGVDLMLMAPASGVVIEPSLGVVFAP